MFERSNIVVGCILLGLAIAGCQAADAPPMRGSNRGVVQNRTSDGGSGSKSPLPLPTQSNEFISFEGGVKVYPALKRVEMPASLIGRQRRPLWRKWQHRERAGPTAREDPGATGVARRPGRMSLATRLGFLPGCVEVTLHELGHAGATGLIHLQRHTGRNRRQRRDQ